MNLLLDTHVLVWYMTNDPKLSESLRADIRNENNLTCVSIASIWEVGIKYSLNKLELKKNLSDFIVDIETSSFKILPIISKNILLTASLPFHHRDPFDRLIIAQAMTENYPVITRDKEFSAYDVNVIWR